ncbi:hypothetical protein [Haloechinothrix sp. LS1_15]|uniref:hypothetical protein n=1 Tax=Haloechinothrix sp. LS1_15 TaxID=2652248 RepID=UPI002946B83C|nr:hypothetical protein [Haloechinothrix sp. LS1_15]MDV6012926.1 hypothetical protein [Haloechinothrix sp. LS1_15]
MAWHAMIDGIEAEITYRREQLAADAAAIRRGRRARRRGRAASDGMTGRGDTGRGQPGAGAAGDDGSAAGPPGSSRGDAAGVPGMTAGTVTDGRAGEHADRPKCYRGRARLPSGC